jgi:hypothetical protein
MHCCYKSYLYAKQIMNIIDIAAIFPWYLDLVAGGAVHHSTVLYSTLRTHRALYSTLRTHHALQVRST